MTHQQPEPYGLAGGSDPGPARPWWALATAIVVLGVLALAALAFLVERRATAAVRAEARTSLAGTASLTSVFLAEHLRGVEKVLDSYARRRLLQEALGAPGGADAVELTRHMKELREARSDVLNVVGIADTEGTMLAGTVMPPPGTDFSMRDWHQGVLRTGRSYVSEAIVGTSPGSPLAIAIATPVRDGRGRINAVIVAGYTLQTLQGFVRGFAAEQDLAITVTDQRGVVVAGPGAAPTVLETRSGDPRVGAALDGRTGVMDDKEGPAGQRVLSAYAPVSGLGWAVVAELPRDKAYAQVAQLRREVLAIAVPLALLLVVGGVLLARALRSRDAARVRTEELASVNSAVLGAVLEGIALVGADGAPLLRNATMQELARTLGMRLEANLYEEMVRVAPAMADPEAYRAATTAMTTDPDLEVSDSYTHVPTGRSFHRYSAPLRGQEGTPLGRLFVMRETTAERQAEASVRRARDEAELANAAKTDFLSRMSHELRTPLHAILGFGQLLEQGDLTPGQRECLAQMTSGGRHLLDLINEVLDLQRVERGELGVSLEPVELSEVADEVRSLIAPLASARGTSVRWAGLEGEGAYLLADRQRLKQVLLNLVANAVKYGRDGGVVTITARDAEQGRRRVEVRDDGAGIAPDRLPLLFQRFERLGADASEVEGTGLGLALSKQLVEAMTGQIGVESVPGEGTTFWFTLPVATPPAPLLDEARSERALRAGPPARRVLLVEDNPANVALVRTILSTRPAVELFAATQGGRALELTEEHHPDLVLLDLNLPDMSGREVLQQLRRRPGEQPTIVILSADATPRQVARLLDEGADAYLTKPFVIQDFLSVVDGSGPPSESAASPPGPDDEPLDLATVQTIRSLAQDPRARQSLVHHLLTTYLSDADARLERAQQALQGDDLATAQAEAHALRGGSAGIGARAVAQLGHDLEVAASLGDRDAAFTALDGLTRALPVARAALAEAYAFALEPAEDEGGATATVR